MELFRSNKKEKPDIEFVTKTKLKQVKFDVINKKGRTRDDLIMLVPNTSPLVVRWILQIPFEDGHEAHFVSGNRPTIETRMEYSHYQDRPFPTRTSWTDLYIEFRNMESGTKVVEWMRELHSEPIQGRTGYVSNYKKNMTLEMVDPTGVIIESWHMVGCTPTEMTFHDEMDENPTVGVNFTIDHAVVTH